MLVLSRRQLEKVNFPALGISVEVLRIAGSTVQLGIDAPPEVRILRNELVDNAKPADAPEAPKTAPEVGNHLRDRLDAAIMGLQLIQHQLDTDRVEDARQTVSHILNLLDSKGPKAVQPRRENTRCFSENRPHALVVEDDANERLLLAGYLRSQGFDVTTVADGMAALTYLAGNENPDFVLLDMRMPGLDGPSTLARIRSSPNCKGLKVFGVSGSDPGDCGVQIGPAGVDSWFSKPLDPARIITALRTDRRSQPA